MPLASLFLFTHLDIFDFIKTWWAIGFGAFTFFYVRYKTSNNEAAAAAKKERADLTTRLTTVEEMQKVNGPKFKEVCEEMKDLKETVKNHHEMRFTGIVGQQELFSKLYEAKLDNANKRVDDLEKRLDKIDTKLDKIMDEVMKINHK